MAESSLSLGYADLQAAVGFYLGWTGTSANWTSEQSDRIDDVIKSGLRRFYHPPIVDGSLWKWRFLRPVFTLTTTASDMDYDMDDDFGGLDCDYLTFAAGEYYPPVRVVAEEQIRDMFTTNNYDGYPRYCATRAKSSTGASGQRWELVLWPTPDDAYVLTGRYQALQNELSDSYPYPLGGEPHAETIRAACLAVAEEESQEGRGVRWQEFIDRLRTSIEFDARNDSPRTLGYNSDPGIDPESTGLHSYSTGVPTLSE